MYPGPRYVSFLTSIIASKGILIVAKNKVRIAVHLRHFVLPKNDITNKKLLKKTGKEKNKAVKKTIGEMIKVKVIGPPVKKGKNILAK